MTDRGRGLNKTTSDAYRIDELDEYINSIEPTNQKINLGDFNIIRLLGRGGFGKVISVLNIFNILTYLVINLVL